MLKATNTFEVPRVRRPSRAEFEERFFLPQRPVIVTGGMEGWPARERWTNEYLKAKVGERMIRVSRAHEGVHFYDGKDRILDFSMMKFGDYVDLVSSDSITDGRIYASVIPIQRSLPELWADVGYPPYFDEARRTSTNLWFGPGNNFSPLHYDSNYNFLTQLRGRKQVLLSPPRDIKNLYPWPINYASQHMSQVNVADPDLARFPRYERADRSLFDLEPGDMLFIPFYWWHAVYGHGQNLSINFWWRTPTVEYLKYPRQTARGLGSDAYREVRRVARRLARRAGASA